jgi:hypothetical protein
VQLNRHENTNQQGDGMTPRYMVIDPDGIAAPNGGTIQQNATYSYDQLIALGFTAAAIAALIAANRLADLLPLEPPPFPPPTT